MEQDPVAAFAALAHPQRLAVMRLLMREYPSRIAAGDIGMALNLRPSTLSGYLAQLLEAGLVTQERRATSLLYAASVTGASALTAEWLGPITGGRAWPQGWSAHRRVYNVLFLGTGNAGPTLVAEAILRTSAAARFEAFSAGIDAVPGAEAATLQGLDALGYTTDDLWPKPLSTWQGDSAPPMDIVITLGDRAAALAPAWPGCPHRAAWRLASGASVAALHTDLCARLAGFVGLDASTPPSDLQAALDAAAIN